MPALTLKVKYSKNRKIAFSASQLIESYFFGLPLCSANGRTLSDKVIADKLLIAQKSIENTLSIKLFKEVLTENVDFIREDYQNWGFMKMNYPINDVLSLTGFLGSVQQITYPRDWASIRKPSQQDLLAKTIHIVPVSTNVSFSNSIVIAGIFPMGLFSNANIPNYWRVEYCTGFDKIPMDIYDAIGKLASIQLLAILGDLHLGVGISSTSLSFDGLSQSISSTRNATASLYQARINQYVSELKEEIPRLKDYYKGIIFTSL